MTDPANLIAWLRAQIDDERQEILRHGPPIPGPPWATGRITTIQAGATVLIHPVRMLAELDAKRRILDLHPYAGLRSAPESCGTCACIPGPCDTVRLLALPYAGRDGYRPEWRPR